MTNLDKNTDSIATKKVQFQTEDDYCIQGYCYYPTQPVKAKLIIACATGVPQAFYRRFAHYMSEQGYVVLSFDYRGIAESAPKHLEQMQMSYLDWGRLDLSAAIAYLNNLKSETNDTQPLCIQADLPLFMIGHSYGGQSLGLSNQHQHIKAMFCFGTGAGWAGYMPPKERFKVQVVWNVVFPPLVALKGYLPWSKFNMGADLPKGVYQEWRQWCKYPHYFFSDPAIGNQLKQQFAQVKTSIYAFSALDDDWALANSRHAFMQYYTGAEMHYIDLDAQDFNMPKIGHMGYFRKDAIQIWELIDQHINRILKEQV